MLFSIKSVLTGAHLSTLVLTASEYPVTIEVLYFYFHPDCIQIFADDTSIIITNPSPSKFKDNINNHHSFIHSFISIRP